MKKTTLMLGVASMAFLAFVSCKKEDNKAVSFQATSSEFVVEDEDRAYLDADNQFVWEKGDLVKMFNIDSDNAANSEWANFAARNTGRTTVFDAVEQMTWEQKTAFYAFFPADNVTVNKELMSNKNRAKFALKPVQEYYAPNGTPSFAKDAMYCASKAQGVNIHQAPFGFDNICGILRLKFSDHSGRKYQSIKVVDKDELSLSGNVTLKVDKVYKEGLTELCEAYDPNSDEWMAQAYTIQHEFGYRVEHNLEGEVAPYNTMTLNLGENGIAFSDNDNDPSVFYIVLRPMALKKGYQVIGVDMNGDEHVFIDSNKDKMIKPNTIKPLSAVDVTDK